MKRMQFLLCTHSIISLKEAGLKNTNEIFKAKGNRQFLKNSEEEQQGQDKNNTDTTLKTKNK